MCTHTPIRETVVPGRAPKQTKIPTKWQQNKHHKQENHSQIEILDTKKG